MSIPQPIEKLEPKALVRDANQRSARSLDRTETEPAQEHEFEWVELIRIAFVALAAAAVWFRVWEPFPRVSVIGI